MSSHGGRRRTAFALAAAVVSSLALPAAATPDRMAPGDDAVVEMGPVTDALRLQAPIEVPFNEAYDQDPLGLVAYIDFQQLFTIGTETWDVWLCQDSSEESLGLTLNAAVAALNETTAEYFEAISEGRYVPEFTADGTSSDADCGIDQIHEGTTPRIYVNDFSVIPDGVTSEVGKGGPGSISWTPDSMLYEGLARRAEVDGATVTEVEGYDYSPAASIAAHEIGHTFHWAHSGAADPYDNELDVMSLGWGGTHGFNLYAAGWIEPEQVAVHVGGDRTYTLGPVGWQGARMIVLSTAEQGHFYTMSVRGPADPVLDADSPVSVDALGIEVYEIDQRPGSCNPLPAESPCFGILTEIDPVPAQAAVYPNFSHFHAAGSTFSIAGVPVSIEANGGDSLTVHVEGGITSSGWFVDDDISVFEEDIEWIAAAGITTGCNPPLGDQFCPDEPITRGQMAAFLVRTLDLPGSSTDSFVDDNASVFQNDINALAASGITTGCTPTMFCPDEPVTRGQMAAFLARAYSLPDGAGDPFTDDNTSVFQNDINALAASGITTGCTPTMFCPDEPVTRGQMAAFLRRAETG